MILSTAPFRISFFGGGTDFPDYYKTNGGCVLSATIDKYCYVTLRHLPPYFEYKNQLTYSKIERFNSPDELEHPLVREALKMLPVENVQISYDADLPACTGLGTSSAFAVALLGGLHKMRGESFTNDNLAKEAIKLEREILKEAGGVQDQLASAFGGFNRIDFNAEGFSFTPVNISEQTKQQLEENLFLFFTGFTRFSYKISADQRDNISSTTAQLNEMKAMVYRGQQLLESGNVDEFGAMLDTTWQLKKQLSGKITNSTIDMLYQKAKNSGATGGKILGAGGGGFMLLYVPKEKQENFKKDFSAFDFVTFKFKNTGVSIHE